MVELKLGRTLREFDFPFLLRLYNVSEERFFELADEDMKAELVEGEMIVHSPALPPHNAIAKLFRHLLDGYAELRGGLGEVYGPDDLVHLASCRHYAPDGFFLLREHVPVPLPEVEFDLVPDLVLEVLSASTRLYDLNEKRPAFREAGVPELWFIDPDRQEVILDRRRGRSFRTTTVNTGRVTSAVVPGFWLETDWLWAEPRPGVQACLRTILG